MPSFADRIRGALSGLASAVSAVREAFQAAPPQKPPKEPPAPPIVVPTPEDFLRRIGGVTFGIQDVPDKVREYFGHGDLRSFDLHVEIEYFNGDVFESDMKAWQHDDITTVYRMVLARLPEIDKEKIKRMIIWDRYDDDVYADITDWDIIAEEDDYPEAE